MIAACREASRDSVMSANLSGGEPVLVGPLAGVPYGLKDLFNIKGWPTHCSSVIPDLVNTPVGADCKLVQKLDQLGASCVVKTQMNEFTYGLSGENPHYGDCRHPFLKECLSGGSSSGSAHMVAAGYLPLAFGTDTGGSLRVPAAWCGLYAIRWVPGYFMDGGFPLAPSFDTMGWFTRSAEDMARMIRCWFADAESTQPRSLKGGVYLSQDQVEPECYVALTRAVERLGLYPARGGGELRSLLPDCQRAFTILQSLEAYGIHEERLTKTPGLYDPAVKSRLERGKTWTAEDVSFAREMAARIENWFENFFATHDFIALPSSPGPAIRSEESTPQLRDKTLRLTAPASLARKPALAVPVRLDHHRTVGLQFIFKDVGAEVPSALLELCKGI